MKQTKEALKSPGHRESKMKITSVKIPRQDRLEIESLVKAGLFYGISDFMRFAVFYDLFSPERSNTRNVEIDEIEFVNISVKFPWLLYRRMQAMKYGETSQYIRKVVSDFLHIIKTGTMEIIPNE